MHTLVNRGVILRLRRYISATHVFIHQCLHVVFRQYKLHICNTLPVTKHCS